ncbi:hypothetical protein ACJX0J_039821, partial [Zea mays]
WSGITCYNQESIKLIKWKRDGIHLERYNENVSIWLPGILDDVVWNVVKYIYIYIYVGFILHVIQRIKPIDQNLVTCYNQDSYQSALYRLGYVHGAVWFGTGPRHILGQTISCLGGPLINAMIAFNLCASSTFRFH